MTPKWMRDLPTPIQREGEPEEMGFAWPYLLLLAGVVVFFCVLAAQA